MSTYQIKRWDAVIFGNNNDQSPMFYITPDMYLLEFFKANQYSVFCEIRGTGSVYDGMIISGVVNQSAYTPNCRPNYFADTNTYVVTLNMDFKGYPKRNGTVIFSGYKNPKPQVKPMPSAPIPIPKRVIPSIHSNKIPVDSIGLPVTQYCENGHTFQCALGTYGCTYNSARFCPQLDDIPVPANQNNVPANNNITSDTNGTSNGGGSDGGGSDGGGTYTPGRYGGTETHTCSTFKKKGGGKTFECQGGTQGCYDDSPMYCQGIRTRQHHCKSPSSLIIDCDIKYNNQQCEDKYCK